MEFTCLLCDAIPALAVSALLYASYRGYGLRLVVEVAASRRHVELSAALLLAASLVLCVVSAEAVVLRLILAYLFVVAVGVVVSRTLVKGLTLTESLALGFPTGYTLTALTTLVSSLFGVQAEMAALAALAVLTLLLYLYGRREYRGVKLSVDVSHLVLALLAAYYVGQMLRVYPAFALRGGSAMALNYMYSEHLARWREFYRPYPEVLHHAFIRALGVLVGPEFYLVNSLIPFFNLFIIVSFYALARRCWGDWRLAAFSTAVYALFRMSPALSALYLALRLLTGYNDYMLIVGVVNRVSMALSENPTLVMLHFTAQSYALTMFNCLMLLLAVRGVQGIVPLTSILVLSGSTTHLPDVMVFLVLHSLLMMLGKGSRRAALGSALGLAAALALYLAVVPHLFMGSKLMLVMLAGVALTVLGVLARGRVRLPAGLSRVRPLVAALLVVYVAAVSEWPDVVAKYNAWEMPAKSVPTLMYPVYLGLTGFLGLFYLATAEVDEGLIPAIALLVVSLALGKLITLSNLYLFYVDYWEIRMLPYQYLALSMLAGGGLLQLVRLASRYSSMLARRSLAEALALLLLVAAVVGQALSTSLYAAYFQLVSGDLFELSRDQVKGLRELRRVECFTVPVSKATALKAVFAAPPFQLAVPDVVANPREPTVPLFLVSNPNMTPVILFMDLDWPISGANPFSRRLIEAAKPIYESPGMRAYKLPVLAPPSENASIALVYEPGASQNATPLMLALSSLSARYTVASSGDPLVGSYRVVIAYDPLDEREAARLLELAGRGAKLVVVSLNGPGVLGGLLFEHVNTTCADSITGWNWTLQLVRRVEVPMLEPRTPLEVLANYTYMGAAVAPLAVEARVGGGELIYVNLHPLLEGGLWFKPLRQVLSTLLGGEASRFEEGVERFYLVKGVSVEGLAVRAFSQSISEIAVRDALLLISLREGVTHISLNGSGRVVFESVEGGAAVRAGKIVVSGGEALYPRIVVRGYFEVAANSTVRVEFEDAVYKFESVESISVVQPGRAILKLRAPLIECRACRVGAWGVYSEDLVYAPVPLKSWAASYRGDARLKVLFAGDYLVIPVFEVDGVSIGKPVVKPRARVLWEWEKRLSWEVAKSSPIVVLALVLALILELRRLR